jgi:oxaloacetate decarboxylase beta subunit
MSRFAENTRSTPLIGAAGVSAVPMSARVANKVGQESNPHNFLLMHAMGPNVAGVIGSAVLPVSCWLWFSNGRRLHHHQGL